MKFSKIGRITFPNSLKNLHGLRMHDASLSIIFGALSQLMAYGITNVGGLVVSTRPRRLPYDMRQFMVQIEWGTERG